MRAVQAAADATLQLAIGARSVHAVVQLPVEELDLLLRLDSDLDGAVSATELAAARQRVAAYVADHLHVKADGAPVPLSLQSLTLAAAAPGYVEAVADGSSATRISEVVIDSTLLREVSAGAAARADIRIGDRTESFLFAPGATFERRLAPDRATSALLVVSAIAAVALLWLFRRRRGATAALLIVLTAAAADADVILSAARLNATLKTMEKLQRQTEPEATFQLGVEADGLADLINSEVEAHGTQERALIDLALRRCGELGVTIAYHRDKKRFFYDGRAFAAYVAALPHGPHVADAAFALLSYRFYQLSPADAGALIAAAEETRRFLTQHPRFRGNAEVRLFLAVDYRDLSRHQLEQQDAAGAARYRAAAADECRRILRTYPGTEQARAARQLLAGLR